MQNLNVCASCIFETGGCCVDVKLFMHEDDVVVFLEAQEQGLIPEHHLLVEADPRSQTWLYHSRKEPCVFLGPDHACSIYDRRPGICSLYPLQWTFDPEEEFAVFIDLLCPLTHSVPLREIFWWAEDEKNLQHMRRMGPLTFDTTTSDMINVTDMKRLYSGLRSVYDLPSEFRQQVKRLGT